MKGISKEHINSTFKESLYLLCKRYGIMLYLLSLDIRFHGKEKNEIEVLVCKDSHPQTDIPIYDLLTPKMVGIRLSSRA